MIRALQDTKIAQNTSTGLYTESRYDLPANLIDKLLNVLVTGTTEALATIKSVDFPVVLKFSKPNGDFICAAIVQYFANKDDKNKPGNWNYSSTFKEEDIPSNSNIKTPYDNELISYFRGAAIDKYNFYMSEQSYYGDVLSYILQQIKKWLDDNASETEENGVSLDGVIQFRVAIENGEKVFAAEPDGEMKLLIKDDAAIEV